MCSDGATARRSRLAKRPVAVAELSELVEWAKLGDEAAWAEIVGRFGRLVRSRIRASGLSGAEADDAAQATWLRLATSLDQLRDAERLGGWLRVTARNEALDLVRRERRLVPSDELDDLADMAIDPNEQLVREDDRSAVRSAVGVLNDRQQAIVGLRYLEPEATSYRDIASQLGLEHGSIGPTIGRALHRLRRHPSILRLRV